MKKTFRIGDLICYEDHFVKAIPKVRNVEDGGQCVGTVIGWSKDSNGRTRAKIQWFDWYKTGPAETEEYFRDIQPISGETK